MFVVHENQIETPLMGSQKSKTSLLKTTLTLCALVGLIGFGGYNLQNMTLKPHATEVSVGEPLTQQQMLDFARAYKAVIESGMEKLQEEWEAHKNEYETLVVKDKPEPLSTEFGSTGLQTMTCHDNKANLDYYSVIGNKPSDNPYDYHPSLTVRKLDILDDQGDFKGETVPNVKTAINKIMQGADLKWEAANKPCVETVEKSDIDDPSKDPTGKQHTHYGFHISIGKEAKYNHMTLRLKCYDFSPNKHTAICQTWEEMAQFYKMPNAECKEILIHNNPDPNKGCGHAAVKDYVLSEANILKVMNQVTLGQIYEWKKELWPTEVDRAEVANGDHHPQQLH